MNAHTKTQSQKKADLRAKIFSSEASTPKSVVVQFFGQEIEIRQPSVKAIFDLRQEALSNPDEDLPVGVKNKRQQSAMVNMIILYAYVPGTEEHIFDDADVDQLLAMPFGEDFTRVNNAITLLTNVDVSKGAATKN